MAEYHITDRGEDIKIKSTSGDIGVYPKAGLTARVIENSLVIFSGASQVLSAVKKDIKTPNLPSIDDILENIVDMIRDVYEWSSVKSEKCWSATQIDCMEVAQTTIVQINNNSTVNKRFIPTKAKVELVDISGALIIGPDISIGTQSPDYNDIVNTTTTTSLNTQYEIIDLTLVTPLGSTDISENPIQVYVSNPPTGSTVYTINVYLFGITRSE